MLREAEVLLNQGSTVGEVCRKLGISEQTYYGGMRVDQAKRLKELEKEKARLNLSFAISFQNISYLY